jgi:hypothetical protein
MSRLLLATLAALAVAGCGGGDETAEPPAAPPTETNAETSVATTAEATTAEAPPEQPTAPVTMPGLPDELAGYQSWTKLNAQPIPPRDSDPHNGTKDVYASVAAENGVYPPGAIVVKEAARPGASYIGLVAMMRKEPGANPEHNDWVMVEWVRDARDAEFEEIASGAVCTSCHMQARDRDYVFTQG